jgi:hypothetical protein
MSKLSEKAVGNQRIVSEVLGDGKLVEEGERQKRERDSDRSDKDEDAGRSGPLGSNDPT